MNKIRVEMTTTARDCVSSICGPVPPPSAGSIPERTSVVLGWLRGLGTDTEVGSTGFVSSDSVLLFNAAVRWAVSTCVDTVGYRVKVGGEGRRVDDNDDDDDDDDGDDDGDDDDDEESVSAADVDGIVEVAEVVCGAVVAVVGRGLGSESSGAPSSSSSPAWSPAHRSIDELVSSVFWCLCRLRRGLKASGAVGEREMRRVDAGLRAAIEAYVRSGHVSAGGFVRAVLLYPLGALEVMVGVVQAGGFGGQIAAARRAMVDDGGRWTYPGIGVYEEELFGSNDVVVMSPVEAGLKGYGYEDIADCHRMLLQLVVLCGADEEETATATATETKRETEKDGTERSTTTRSLLNAVILRLTSRVLQKKHTQHQRSSVGGQAGIHYQDGDVGAIAGAGAGGVGAAGEGDAIGDAVDAVDAVVAMDASNFEEGELLVSVTAHDADMRRRREVKREVVGVVPKAVGCGVVVRGLKTKGGDAAGDGAITSEFIRQQCDAFAAVKSVSVLGDGGDATYVITMTSMVGAVRCFEAMCTRERRFWGKVGNRLVGVPEVSLVEGEGSHTRLLLEGVESIEQEERVKEMLEEKGLKQPNSWVPVGCPGAGVKGVVICFESEHNGLRAFEGLGGAPAAPAPAPAPSPVSKAAGTVTASAAADPKKRGSAGVEEGSGGGPPKRAKVQSTQPAQSKVYAVSRNKQIQGNFVVQVLDDGPPFDVNWPKTLEASQRADIKYLTTLFASNPRMRVGALWPAEERDAAGLQGLDAYLRQKGRAGVVVLDRRTTIYLIPSTAEGFASVGVGARYDEIATRAMLCVMVSE